MYEHGHGVDADAVRAVDLYTHAAEQGEVEAAFLLGEHLASKNRRRALKWYQRAAKDDHLGALYAIGLIHGDDKPPKRAKVAKESFERAVKLNSAPAKHQLSRLLAGGGRRADAAAALRWCREAAADGYPPALVDLGARYVEANGVDENLWEAYKQYHRAAIQGYSHAYGALAQLFEEGWGVDEDPLMAVSIFVARVSRRTARR